MNKTFRIYGILLLGVIVLLTFLKLNKKEILDWRKNFDTREKTPFGMLVFNQEADDLLHKQLERVKSSPFDYYKKHKTTQPHSILIVNKHIDAESWKKILSQIERGSDLLLFDSGYSYYLADTLHFSTYHRYDNKEQKVLYLTDKKFLKDSILLDKFPSRMFFDVSYEYGEILGTSDAEEEQEINFVKFSFGKGNIYLHSEPLILTNYYLLQSQGKNYIQDVFSYLSERKTIWFVEDYEREEVSSSPMRFILENPSLRYAWWLLLAGLLLFVVFNVRRKQRIIPMIEKPKNKSLEFVKSIGNLYLQEGNIHDMMLKKTQYFLNRVRMELLIDTQHLDEHFISKLQVKTGQDKEFITEAVTLMKKAQNPNALVTAQDLININRILDQILK